MKSRVIVLVLLVAVLLASQNYTFAQKMTYSEAPMLAEKVAKGELAPVEERLPKNPLVVKPLESIGVYGGVWRMGTRGGTDDALFTRTVGYQGLVRWAPDWSGIVPDIAEKWEVNAEGTEYTFYLREGMKWSDGEPFTADDIVFWVEDVVSNTELYPAPPKWMTAGGKVGVAEKVDTYVVKFKFEKPNGLFLQNLATPNGVDVVTHPRHYFEQYHAKYNEDVDKLVKEAGLESWRDLFSQKGAFIGAGGPRWQNAGFPTLMPWVVEVPLSSDATQVVLVRNPYFFKVDTEGNQLPYLDQVIATVGAEVETLVLKALNGEIDMQDRHIATNANKAVFFDNKEKGGYDFFTTIPAAMNTMIISLNLTHKDPVKREIFQNKDFRIGLSHAINRQELIDLVFVGEGEPYQAAPRPTSPLFNEQLAKQYTEYSVEKANEFLDKAGYSKRDADGFRLGPDGKPISFVVEVVNVNKPQVDMMELVIGYWKEVGINAQVLSEDRSIMYEHKEANEHDAAIWAGDGGLDVILEPRYYFPYSNESIYAEGWQYWYNNPKDERAVEPPAAAKKQMELYDQIKITADAEKQSELMKELLQISADEFWAIGISLPAEGYGIVKNNFHNVPKSFPNAFLYPHPGPTNTFTYYIK